MDTKNNKQFTTIFEFVKWGIVVWLLWPLLSFQAEKMPLWRMVFGVMLAVIFLGKMFYDFVLDNFKQKKEHYTITDLLMLVGFVALVAIIVGGVILIIGVFLATQIREAGEPS